MITLDLTETVWLQQLGCNSSVATNLNVGMLTQHPVCPQTGRNVFPFKITGHAPNPQPVQATAQSHRYVQDKLLRYVHLSLWSCIPKADSSLYVWPPGMTTFQGILSIIISQVVVPGWCKSTADIASPKINQCCDTAVQWGYIYVQEHIAQHRELHIVRQQGLTQP